MPKTIYKGQCYCRPELNCMANTETLSQAYENLIDITNRRILMVGLCLLDVINVVERYPEEDTEAIGLSGYWQRGGNASKSSTVLRHLGVDCEYLGILSSAPAFNFLAEDCKSRGIEINNCAHVPNDPGISTVWVSLATGSHTRVKSNRTFPIFKYEHFRGLDLSQYYWIHFEACNCAETIQMIKDVHKYNATQKHRIPISLDVEINDKDSLQLCELVDYIILSKAYCRFMKWNYNAYESALAMRAAIKSKPEMDNRKAVIIVPWSSEGVGYLDQNDTFEMIPPFPPPKIIDILGAGDTFLAGLLWGLAVKQLPPRDAVVLGNRCAGYKIGHHGYDCIADLKKALNAEERK